MLKFGNDYFVKRDEILNVCPDKLINLLDRDILSTPGITLDDKIGKFCIGKVPECAKGKYYDISKWDNLWENKSIEGILMMGNVELEDFVEITSHYAFIDKDGKKVTLSDISILPYGEIRASGDDSCYVDITEINNLFDDILDIKPMRYGYRIRIICQCDYIWRLIHVSDFIRHIKDVFYPNDDSFDLWGDDKSLIFPSELFRRLYDDIHSGRINLSKYKEASQYDV